MQYFSPISYLDGFVSNPNFDRVVRYMSELRSIVKKAIAPNSTKNRGFTDITSPAQGNFVHRQCPVHSFSHTANLSN